MTNEHQPSFERALNAEQLAAATAPDGPILVLAAAGTGKTRTLVYRVAHLVRTGIAPESILLLTFTNKAAREMLDRATSVAGPGVSAMWGGTFHHMANRILRRHAQRLGFASDFTILDRDDSLSLIKRILKDMKADTSFFPKPEVLLGVISHAANTEKDVEDMVEARFPDLEPAVRAEVADVAKRYAENKRKLGAMDFDDLLVNGLRLFRDHPDILRRYQEQFRHVLVDEYQDTNAIQAEWVNRVAGLHRNLLVVGDDFQSIYAWRGADYRNIMTFQETYPDARVFKLETNYRSTPEILAVANACIAGNPNQYQKVLRSTRETYEKPVAARVRDGESQARYVAEQARRLQREGYRLDEMAVLYRAHFHAMELQMQLTKERFPFVITSGVRFFEQAHIKDACALLRLLQNPHDAMAFQRIAELLPGVGMRTAQKAWDKLGGVFRPREAADRQRAGDLLPPGAREGWRHIAETYETAAAGAPPGDVVETFVAKYYARHASRVFENADNRLEDIQEMARFMVKYESLEAFLSEVALMTNLDAEAESESRREKAALRLCTVHQAKGLEWKVVFVLWATEGMFPSGRALAENAAGDEEERRLFYVAVTRAKDELLIGVPEMRRGRDGSVTYTRPSRFLNELPKGLVRELRLPYC